MSGKVYREATAFAQRQDEFTKDAAFFGIEVPVTYGCISGCKFCLDFRNEVRTARERYDAQWQAFTPRRFEPFEFFGTPKTADERIADALELIAARLA